MKTILVFSLFILLSLLNYAQPGSKYALVLHGGAGVMSQKSMTPDMQKEYISVLDRALQVGDSVLKTGGNCMDAVVSTIMVMEDSPLFNAGKGAVFTHDGTVELDASVMNGKTLEAGAVAGITDVKNPIMLAKTVMEKSEHVFMVGKGASQFAVEQGFKLVPNSYFYSPIIGAGTYANNATGGFSCTGHGEYYIRLGFSRDISAMMEYQKLDIQKACQAEISKLTQLGGTGGVIGLDKTGNISMEFNTPGMFRGYIKSSGEKYTAIFK